MHAASLYCGNNAFAPLKSVNRRALNIFERCNLYLLFILEIRAVFFEVLNCYLCYDICFYRYTKTKEDTISIKCVYY